ncbi:MAG: S41 family peptidase [Actinomycetota bacterium]|nr:S41 family peptidase [Actinomycetota bacterium]MDQ2957320.1 S41 family peptidase [Actinomycetota bacterium]
MTAQQMTGGSEPPRIGTESGVFNFGDLSDSAWRADYEAVAFTIAEEHPGSPRSTHVDAIRERAKLLNYRLPSTPEERLVELIRMSAMVGDGHTRLKGLMKAGVCFPGLRRFPFTLRWLEDGLFVTSTNPAWRHLLGCRVIEIEQWGAAAIVTQLASLASADNAWRVRAVVPGLAVLPDVLAGVGVVSPTDDPLITFETAEKNSIRERVTSDLVTVDEVCQWQTRSEVSWWPVYGPPTANFSFRDLEGSPGTVYAAYNSARDEPDSILEEQFGLCLDHVEQTRADRLILDLRSNGGGNLTLNRPLIEGIQGSSRVNSPGRLGVLIGRHTFSAAMICAVALESQTAATFVGEPTGAKPNHYGDAIAYPLPSGLADIEVSSLWWQTSDPWDIREAIVPQVAAADSSAAYLAGEDRCLLAALTYLRNS